MWLWLLFRLYFLLEWICQSSHFLKLCFESCQFSPPCQGRQPFTQTSGCFVSFWSRRPKLFIKCGKTLNMRLLWAQQEPAPKKRRMLRLYLVPICSWKADEIAKIFKMKMNSSTILLPVTKIWQKVCLSFPYICKCCFWETQIF